MLFFGLDDTGLSNKDDEIFEKEGGLGEYIKFFRGEKHLKHWIVIRLCRDGFMSLQAIFIPLWTVNFKGANATMLGVLSTLSAASSILMHVPAGKLADKIGRKKTFFLFSSLYCLGIIILILAPSFEFLVLAYILGWGMGGMGGVALTILTTMWWEGISTENRGKLYGVEGIISASSRIPITAIGGVLWDKGLQTLVLTLPVLAELFIVMPIMYTVPETFKNKNDLTSWRNRI
jgi:MFS family permease